MQSFTAAPLTHSDQSFLIDEQKSICIAAQLACLTIQHCHFFQILLGVCLVSEAQHQCLQMGKSLLLDSRIIPYRRKLQILF